MKIKKLVISLLVVIGIVFSVSGCDRDSASDNRITLRVANWEEYIDESMVDEFEKWYENTYGKKIKVEYSTFGTNEDLYNQMSIGDVFDLACPSEYMIMKLMNEDKVLPYSEEFFDTDNKENYYARCVSPYIEQRLKEFTLEDKSVGSYAAGYMWGTLGFVYNPKEVSQEEVQNWDFLLNSKYNKRITIKDSIRDCYFVAMGMITADEVRRPSFVNSSDYSQKLCEKLNDTSDNKIDKVRDILTNVKDNVYSFETDSGKSDLVSGKVVANLQWSGDAVYSIDQAKEDGVELKYAVPEESTNMWFDGWCLLKDGIGKDKEKKQAAEAFVNFVSRPENAVRNMEYIGYTSVISGGEYDTVYSYIEDCYGDDAGSVTYDLGYFFGDYKHKLKTTSEQAEGELFAQYPTEEVIRRSVVMACFNEDVNQKINRMWIDIRCFNF